MIPPRQGCAVGADAARAPHAELQNPKQGVEPVNRWSVRNSAAATLALMAGLPAPVALAQDAKAKPPNILFIMGDDIG